MCLNNYDYHILNHQHHHHRHHYCHCCHRNLILNPHLKPSHHPKERIVIAWEKLRIYIYISVDFIWTGCVVVSLEVQKKSIQACRCWSTAAALHEWNGLQQVTSTIMSTWIALTPSKDLWNMLALLVDLCLNREYFQKDMVSILGIFKPIMNKWKWFGSDIGKPMNPGSSWDKRVWPQTQPLILQEWLLLSNPM